MVTVTDKQHQQLLHLEAALFTNKNRRSNAKSAFTQKVHSRRTRKLCNDFVTYCITLLQKIMIM